MFLDPKDMPPVNIDDVIEQYKRDTLRKFDDNFYTLSDEVHAKVRKFGDKLTYKFDEYRLGARYVDEFVNDELRPLYNNMLRNQIDRISDEFLENFNRARRELDELRDTRLKPEEISHKILNIKAKFCGNFGVPNPTWIEGCMDEFRQSFIARYHLQDNYDLKYEITRMIRQFGDEVMEDFYSMARITQNKFTDEFVQAADQVEIGLKQQEQNLDMIEDPSLIREDKDKVIITEGKSQEELYEEKQAQLNSVLSDTTLTPEQRDRLYDEVAARYDKAIAGLPANAPVKKGDTPQDLNAFFL